MVNFQNRIISREEEQKNIQKLFVQTAMALVDAIDAKDQYTQGHSSRVAKYSKKIAEMAGKNSSECEEIYYAALLHDVGKIGVPENIIQKNGGLNEQEFKAIKEHPDIGAQILQRITAIPYLSIGANFHHERFDGTGYPAGLKGEDIPEIARIIAVADAYDAMTSKRSYRDPLPQDKVREELIECSGVQFDPEYANIMVHLLDLDQEYEMQERIEREKGELLIGEHREEVYEGIVVTQNMVTISFEIQGNNKVRRPNPSIILFDSLDGRFHREERDIIELVYYEYCEIWFDGSVSSTGVRKTETKQKRKNTVISSGEKYRIEAVRIKDHALIKMFSSGMEAEVTIALPDSTRYTYIGITGEYCTISHVKVDTSEEPCKPDYIKRIAEEVSYINAPAGDIPNVQVDGYRSDSTKGIPIQDGMVVSFHTKSLPTARLVWHCPSYVIFTSDDGTVNGENYTEFSLVRLDGEAWKSRESADNELLVNRSGFLGWDDWKDLNKKGYDCTISFQKDGNRIISATTNGGIEIKCITWIKIESDELYVALSGDQVALTGIKIKC